MVNLLWNIVGASGLLSVCLAVWDVSRGQLREAPQPSEASRPSPDGPGRIGNVRVVSLRRDGRHPASIWVHDSGDVGVGDVRHRAKQEAWR